MKRSRVLMLIAGVLLGAGAYYLYAGSDVPKGQAAMVRLDSANFAGFKQAFNEAKEQVRMVAMLSPTCSTCLRGASALERALDAQMDTRIRVFVVWEPVLVTDWAAPSSFALARIFDRRAQQYWDPGRLLSKTMGETDRSSIVWDYVAVHGPGSVWQDAPPKPLFEDGPVLDVTDALTKAIDLTLKQQ